MIKHEFICDCNVIHEDIVLCVKGKMLENVEIGDLTNLFKILGDQTRVRILWSLECHELCVCDIANVLNMTKSAVSHQLAVLRKSNFVKTRKTGKEVYYSLADAHVKLLLELGLEHTREKVDI